jgi:hypothetical protein
VIGHNWDHSSHSPFLHAAPVQGAHAPDAGFLYGRMHLYRGWRRTNLNHPSLVFGRVPLMEWGCLLSHRVDYTGGQAHDPVLHHHGRVLGQP